MHELINVSWFRQAGRHISVAVHAISGYIAVPAKVGQLS